MCITWNSDERYAEFYPDGIDILRKFSTVKGSSRRFNSVVAIKLKDTETLIIIHIELQSSVHHNFHERIFQYYSLLHNVYQNKSDSTCLIFQSLYCTMPLYL